ncbi:variant erythrocyte surface antigen-1 family protein [Babesia caballi]|uniref:Variant erythrocyte surface antigen-1 family protein n=1 Tax=Babesia caballi TaxID=5871 RepID=A0AAV4LNY8_BABCB|nr:variant erythrocyte surface antigen-1 family protein [Babesia caballi]
MTTGKKKLTEPPQNLKEAIDWVLCMSGNYGEGGGEGKKAIQKLATKVITLVMTIKATGISFGTVHGVSVATLLGGDVNGSVHSKRPITSLANGLRGFIAYSNGIGKQSYDYSYSDKNPSQKLQDNEDAAKFFMGSIPLLFFGLSFFYWMCREDGGKWYKENFASGSPLTQFLEALGFSGQLNDQKMGSNVSSMFSGFDEFKIYDGYSKTYPDFLRKVGHNAFKQFQSKPNDYPLYTLYYFSYHYLQYQHSKAIVKTVNGSPNNEEEVLATLIWLGEAMATLNVQGLEGLLSLAYENLRSEITNALPYIDISQHYSAAAPVAGTLTTLGLGGGAAAAYLFNLGGAKTLVNGLLRIG